MGKQEDVTVTFGADLSALEKDLVKANNVIKKSIGDIRNVMATDKLQFRVSVDGYKNDIKDAQANIKKLMSEGKQKDDPEVLKERAEILKQQVKINKATRKHHKEQQSLQKDLNAQMKSYREAAVMGREAAPLLREQKKAQKELNEQVFTGANIKAHFNNAYHLKMYEKNLVAVRKEYGNTLDKVQQMHVATKRTNSAIKKSKGEFQGWAMSIMFFGMALKRMFDMVWKTSTKTFNDVMKSIEGSVTGFMMLDGALKYLGFTAGAALEPIAMFLIPIIDKISQWITENEKLFAAIVIGLGVFGTLFAVLGSGVLAIAGFVFAWGQIAPFVTALGTAIAALSLPVVLGVIAAIAAAVLLWKNNVGDLQGTFWALWDILGTTASAVIDDLKLIFGGLWDFLNGLFTGDFELVISGFKDMWTGAGNLIEDVMLASSVFTWNVFAGMVNMLKDLFINLAKLLAGAMISAIDKILPWINKMRKALFLKPILEDWDLEEKQAQLDTIVDDFKNVSALPIISGEKFKAMMAEQKLQQLANSGQNFTAAAPEDMVSREIGGPANQSGGTIYKFYFDMSNSVVAKEEELQNMFGVVIEKSMSSVYKGE